MKPALLFILFLFAVTPVSAATRPAHKNIFFPIVFSTPETDVAFGIGDVLVMQRDAAGPGYPSDVKIAAVYTLKDQWTFDLYPTLRTASWDIGGGITLMRYPDRFFGMGAHTRDDQGEVYTLHDTTVRGFVIRKFGRLSAGLAGEARRQTVSDVEDGGLLASGAIEGSAGGAVAGLGAVVRYDSRDSLYYPSRGAFCELSAFSYNRTLGSDYTFTRLISDNRLYRRLSSAGIAVFHLQIETAAGDVPFRSAPSLGGPTLLRGYYQGRYRDTALCLLQTEYRHRVSGRLHGAVFGSAGRTMPRLSDLAADRLKAAWGCGLRYSLDAVELINVRLDIAFGESGSSGVYFMLFEAF